MKKINSSVEAQGAANAVAKKSGKNYIYVSPERSAEVEAEMANEKPLKQGKYIAEKIKQYGLLEMTPKKNGKWRVVFGNGDIEILD